MIAEAEQQIKPVLDQLWNSLADAVPGSAVGWVAGSVGTICGCLHPHGALMAAESLFGWRNGLSDKRRREVTLPVARTLRTIAQTVGLSSLHMK